MSGVGITYIWASKGFPSFVRLEGRHGDCEVYTPERTCRFDWALAKNGWADHTCSNCGYTRNTDIHVSLGYKYCPNCGARVIGGDE